MDNSIYNEQTEISDNADNGLRGNRAKLTGELIEKLNDEYNFGKNAEYTDLGGSSCLNLCVDTDEKRYVVRVYRPYVRPDRLNDIIHVKTILNKNGIPCSKTLNTKDHKNWVLWNDRLIEAEYFVAYDSIMDSEEKIKGTLPLFGKMTSVMNRISNISADGLNPPFANHIHINEANRMTKKACGRILSWNTTEYERKLAHESEKLAEMVTQEGQKLFEDLPEQLSHGDFWDNNILYNEDKVVLIADFDFMGERKRIEDIALTLYFYNYFSAHNPGSRSRKSEAMSTERAAELKELINLYETGLDEPLTGTERISLPIALALQPLWSIGGWVSRLDDENAARQHASDMLWNVKWGIFIMENLEEWQDIFLA